MKIYERMENYLVFANFICLLLAFYGLLQINDSVSFWMVLLLLSTFVVPLLFALPMVIRDCNLSISNAEATAKILQEMRGEYGIQFYVCETLSFIGMLIVCSYMIYFNYGLRWVGVGLLVSSLAIRLARFLIDRKQSCP